ncbi:MAG: hypothetical protein HKL88_06070 [Bacteroidia bacterium]|nr:hypothetical protein [Bacteroidia bacterium]
MKKNKIFERLQQNKISDTFLPAFSDKDKEILNLLIQGKSYTDIQTLLNVYPAQIALVVKKSLAKMQPADSVRVTEPTQSAITTEKTDKVAEPAQPAKTPYIRHGFRHR